MERALEDPKIKDTGLCVWGVVYCKLLLLKWYFTSVLTTGQTGSELGLGSRAHTHRRKWHLQGT